MCRLQTVTRVDQDFDIRRVQTGAEKYIPVYRCRPKTSVPVKKVYQKEKNLTVHYFYTCF